MVVLLEGSPFSTEDHWSSVRVTIRFLVTSLTKALLPRLHSLAARPSLGVLVVPKLLRFKNDGGHCVLGDLQCCTHFWYPSPDLCLDTILSRRSTVNYLDLIAWVLLWHALSTVRHFIDRCVPFQIISNQYNLP